MSMTTAPLKSFGLTRLPPLVVLATLSIWATASAQPANAQQVTYAKDVAPIFQARCTQCHHAGTGAPMALTSFEEVRPWARSIKTRVASREMPPWHLDKSVGIRHYKNDLSLSEAEIATIVKWVDAGAPGGTASDAPPPQKFAPEDAWHIGKPDLVVPMSDEHTMYAKGPDWWIDYFAEVEIPEDRYIKAMEIRPGTRRIVHHVVMYVIEPDAPASAPEGGISLHEYAVGKYGDTFAPNTGRLLKKGSRLRFDMHYFAVGEELKDRTEMAFIFYPKGYVPKYEVRSINGYFRLNKPARIDAFQPHMHMRGKAMTLEAILPDNSVEILSSVDHFDFNWHVSYLYSDGFEPLLPAGTVLHMIGVHDNTASNKRNPDPSMWVGFGERSVDDMLQLWINVVYLDDAEFIRLVAERAKSGGKASTQQQQQP
jgi:mono/diheme cytochrome c family protein